MSAVAPRPSGASMRQEEEKAREKHDKFKRAKLHTAKKQVEIGYSSHDSNLLTTVLVLGVLSVL